MKKQMNLVLFSLIGDALALGPHWVYKPEEIKQKLGVIRGYADPITEYHPGKKAGDFTHYGDQAMILFRSIKKNGGFDLEKFADDWQAFWNDPGQKSYRDGATKETLKNLAAGASPKESGSQSHDIGGASRMAALWSIDWTSEEALLNAARTQTAFTHRLPEVVESAEFFARVVLSLTKAKEKSAPSIPEVLRKTFADHSWEHLSENWLKKAEESAASAETDQAALAAHGLACNTEYAFPSICHLLLRYPEDPAKALLANVSAGGDSAARGLILGMVYGAVYLTDILPSDWLEKLRVAEELSK